MGTDGENSFCQGIIYNYNKSIIMEKQENKTEKISINFKKFKLFKDISQTDSTIMDVSRDFSDLMYKNMNGIAAHDLALRIYRSSGEIELNREEVDLLLAFATQTTPIFYDSLQANIKCDGE